MGGNGVPEGGLVPEAPSVLPPETVSGQHIGTHSMYEEVRKQRSRHFNSYMDKIFQYTNLHVFIVDKSERRDDSRRNTYI